MHKHLQFLLNIENDQGGGGGTPPPAFTPSFEGAIKPDGSFTEAWHQKAFGPEYNGPLAQAKTFADVDKMLRDSMAAARAKTDGMVKIPGENATPEEIAAYYKAIGVPEKPEDYGLKAPEKLPEGVQHDAKMEAAFLGKARELGLNAKQVQALRDFQLSYVGETVAASKAEMAKAIEAEKAELTQRFGDKLDSTVATAKALVNAKWVPDAMKKYLNDGAADPQSGNFAGADFLEFAVAAARAAGEDGLAGGAKPMGNAGNTPAYWQNVLKDKSHPDHVLLNKQDPDAVRRYNEAYASQA